MDKCDLKIDPKVNKFHKLYYHAKIANALKTAFIVFLGVCFLFLSSLTSENKYPQHSLNFSKSAMISSWALYTFDSIFSFSSSKKNDLCPQSPPIFPKRNEKIDNAIEIWKKDVTPYIEKFANGIRFQTESFDDMKANKASHSDPRYLPYLEFIKFLEANFPLIHENLKKELINDYSLVFFWEGADTTLKPIMLCAHYDVVPVNPSTWDQWQHPPFSGYNDGKYIWGRGTEDTKGTLFASLEAIEILISADFIPSRGIVLAFGFDEELSGFGGAKFMAEYISKTLGFADGIEFLVDEGNSLSEVEGTTFAVVGVAEKGYADINYSVLVPGGHSSVPPDNTGIGIISQLIADLEDHPFDPELNDDSAYLKLMQCVAEYSESLDPYLRWAIKNIQWARQSVIAMLYPNPKFRYQFTSSQAVDLIHGGVKVNALPEVTTATVNYRIALHSDFSEILEHVLVVAEREAEFYNLSVVLKDYNYPSVLPLSVQNKYQTTNENRFGKLVVEVLAGTLEVAPVTPSYGSEAWDVLAGTIRSVFEESAPIVAPSVMGGNSDTRHYWGLTKNIFRFSPVSEGYNLHTVDEH
ncbi:hypothetical protein HK096_006777, partial [Nowakowskiella sp. JEL0078]